MSDRPWRTRNFFGSPEDLCAVGAVIAGWNLCEQALEQILYRILKTPWETTVRTFNLLNNHARIELMLLEGKRLLTDDDYNHVEIFSRYYAICRDNRNLIAHAAYNKNEVEGGMSLSKISGKDRITRNSFRVSTSDMIEVADAIYDLGQFGFLLSHAIWAGPSRILYAGEEPFPANLPTVFPQPRKLPPFVPTGEKQG